MSERHGGALTELTAEMAIGILRKLKATGARTGGGLLLRGDYAPSITSAEAALFDAITEETE